jgi:hypothetical protein
VSLREKKYETDKVRRWVCTGTGPVGIYHKMSLRSDVRCSGSAMLPTSSRHTAFQGRITPFSLSMLELRSNRCAINPEHCDTAFPSELQNLSGDKSYFILRFELSQLSSEFVMSIQAAQPR